MSVTIADPCFYCGREIRTVAREGCGSGEFAQATVDRFCRVLQWARRNVKADR